MVNMAGTLLQTLVPEALRGRVANVYSLVATAQKMCQAIAQLGEMS
ncbi:MAG TPA: hypothetical protein VKQ72_02975 [Aggregatilineales bacterium]|nr:hypothetical protein [Aggregatilineales bacterium]